MPLGLKELETGHYVLFVVSIKAVTRDGWVLPRRVFTGDKKLSERLVQYLRDYIKEDEYNTSRVASADVEKEIVIFDGGIFHALSGNKYLVSEVQKSMEYVESNIIRAGDEGILHLFLLSRLVKRVKRPIWQRSLINLCCLCCYVNKSIAVRD